MFEVQIVQQRRAGSGLQALRRRFSMVVSDQCLTITAKSSSSSPSTEAVLSILHNDIKTVRSPSARQNKDTTGSRDHVGDLGLEMSTAEPEAIGMEGLVKYYVNDPNFRQLVHEIHDHIDSVVASETLSYEATMHANGDEL
ncbi:hypothetical protein PInf_025323 [Phytophthora infestans]|nr:hypothetical protein PInf_025323 [Phytophthora infestans]